MTSLLLDYFHSLFESLSVFLVGLDSLVVYLTILFLLFVVKKVVNYQTIKAYKENTQALEERVKIVEQETSHCQEQHAENLTKITHMEGELKAYKELVLIPADFLKELQRNQLEIIKLIKESNVNTKRIKK
jgi:membrane protein insertase Oxa1/YidC/SpoIIIJ